MTKAWDRSSERVEITSMRQLPRYSFTYFEHFRIKFIALCITAALSSKYLFDLKMICSHRSGMICHLCIDKQFES